MADTRNPDPGNTEKTKLPSLDTVRRRRPDSTDPESSDSGFKLYAVDLLRRISWKKALWGVGNYIISAWTIGAVIGAGLGVYSGTQQPESKDPINQNAKTAFKQMQKATTGFNKVITQGPGIVLSFVPLVVAPLEYGLEAGAWLGGTAEGAFEAFKDSSSTGSTGELLRRPSSNNSRVHLQFDYQNKVAIIKLG